MKYCAIICEFNPLHNGHVRIISEAKRITGLPVICLMSGNFCQRGEAAILEKHIRAQHAIAAGASIVFELPTAYSTGSANTFAKGAVEVLKNLPVSHLVFGSECGSLDLLNQAKELSQKLENNSNFTKELSTGISYKSALKSAAKSINSNIAELFEKPNNTLAIEYLKALENTDITPITIQREDNYLDMGEVYSSSSQIRREIKSQESPKNVPNYVAQDLKNYKNDTLVCEHLFFATKLASKEKIASLFSVSEGLENRIFRVAQATQSYNEFIENAVTKRYSRTRLRRILLENFFNITKDKMQELLHSTQTIQLLAKSCEINFNGFFLKPINLVLKKSDQKKYQDSPSLNIDILAEKLYER